MMDDDIFDEGYQAYEESKSVMENPYKREDGIEQWGSWIDGWLACEQDQGVYEDEDDAVND